MNKNTSKSAAPQGKTAAPKKELVRPEMKLVNIVMTNGDTIQVKMYTKETTPQTRRLSIDAHSHHAWQTAENKTTTSQAQKFMDRFAKKR